MASSSHSHQTLKNCNNTEQHNVVEEKESKVGQEEEEDWLQLGLGLGFGTSCRKIVGHGSNPVLDSSPSPSPSRVLKNHPELGFEQSSSLLGPNDNEGLKDVVGMEPPSNNDRNLLGWSDLCSYYHYHNHNNNGVVLWPSWQMDCQGPIQIPAPRDSHRYCPRSPPESGLWFTLRSCPNRSGEALPQIPKAYIRVKDENMTVFVVKKYLARKLGLSNEAEIDISCMGQSLSHMLTLKQVRDTVWLPRLVEPVNLGTMSMSLEDSNDMPIQKHLLSLLYRKHCILN